MAEDQVATRRDSPRDTFLWTRIFSTFRVALDPKKLLLAAAGIVAMAVGWWILSVVFYNSRSVPHRADYRVTPGDNTSLAKREAEEQSDQRYDAAFRRYLLLANTAGPGDNNVVPYERKDGTTENHYFGTGRLRTWPWVESRGPNPFLLVESALVARPGHQAISPYNISETHSWFLVLIEPLVKFLEPVIYLFHPDAGFWNSVYFLLVILCTLVVWAFFGGAITRMASVQFARNEKIGMTEAVRFAKSRYVSFLFAPLFPLILLAFLTFLLLVYWFFGALTVFFGDIVIAGLFYPLVILFGLVMALTLVGLVGWPLMYATISAEGSDSFDALSRSYSYVYQAPWHYLWYSLVAIAYGMVVVFFVGFMGSLVVYMGKWGTSQAPLASALDRQPDYLYIWAPTSFGWRDLLLDGGPAVYSAQDIQNLQARLAKGDSPKAEADQIRTDLVSGKIRQGALRAHYMESFHFWNYIGAALVAFWIGLIFLLVLGFGYSFFWSAGTIIYLLMRRKVDETDLDEVHLEEDEMDEPYVPPAPAAGAAKPPAGGGSLIPPESLTLRTPAAPGNEPLPGTSKAEVSEPAKVESSQVVAPPPHPPETPGTGAAPAGDGNKPV